MSAVRPKADGGKLSPEQIVQGAKNLPSAPKVLPQLKRLLVDSNSSMENIVKLIRLDASIAARVLQVGNSAYFSSGLHCQTVDEAVNRVGYALIYNVVSYAVASQVLVRPLEVYSIAADEFWKQSVACALSAERLAAITGDDVGTAYTLGLLHRIGMAVINEWALRERPQLRMKCDSFPDEFALGERKILGCTQSEVGAERLRLWQFAADITEPLIGQSSSENAATRPRMTNLLYAARWIRATVCVESSPPPPLAADLLASLPITHDQLDAVASDVRTRLQSISTLLAGS
jgi:HD-like signal output (HDOD) protein